MEDKSFGVIPFIKDNNKILFLLIKHKNGEHWAFPKGHAEINETETETALREVREEAGLKNVNLFENTSFEDHYFFEEKGLRINKTVKYFLGEVKDTNIEIQEEEVLDYGWYKFDEAQNLITFSGAKEILKNAQNYLEQYYSSR